MALSDNEFQALIRDHLLPHPATRTQWTQLWDLIYVSEPLANRTLGTMEEFLESVTELLADPNAEASDVRRAARFERQVNEAWSRIQTQGKLRPDAALRRLAIAVRRHHGHAEEAGKLTWYDEQLWNTMTLLNLDRPDEEQ